MAKKGAKKAAAEAPAPKKATTISASVDMQFSDLVGMLLQVLHLFITTFFLHDALNAALWTKSLASLLDRNRGKILREIFRSLCWRPQTSPPRVDGSNPEERLNIFRTSRRKSFEHHSNVGGIFLGGSPYLASPRQLFEQSILSFWKSFILLFRNSARKFLAVIFSRAVDRRSFRSQLDASPNAPRGQIRR